MVKYSAARPLGRKKWSVRFLSTNAKNACDLHLLRSPQKFSNFCFLDFFLMVLNDKIVLFWASRDNQKVFLILLSKSLFRKCLHFQTKKKIFISCFTDTFFSTVLNVKFYFWSCAHFSVCMSPKRFCTLFSRLFERIFYFGGGAREHLALIFKSGIKIL